MKYVAVTFLLPQDGSLIVVVADRPVIRENLEWD